MGSRRFFQARAGKPDANAEVIIKALRAMGHFVIPIRSSDPGVPDLLAYPLVDWMAPMSTETHLDILANGSRPVFLELKVAKGKLRQSQIEWRASAEARGVRVVTVRSIDEALEALK